MAKLYEKFVLNFYKIYLEKEVFNFYSPKLKWNQDKEIDEEYLMLLPEMRIEIVAENKNNNLQIIINTKYYAQTLVSSYWMYVEKVWNGHLYQIFDYVNNSSFLGNKKVYYYILR